MGSCLTKCFGTLKKRKKSLKKRRLMIRKRSVEFEALMDDNNATAQQNTGVITDLEKHQLMARQFDVIVHEQTQVDEQQAKQPGAYADSESDIQPEAQPKISQAFQTSLVFEDTIDLSFEQSYQTSYDSELAEQEEELRQQEERRYEARREARLARHGKCKHKSPRQRTTINGARVFLGDDDDLDLGGGGDDDFEVFLTNVKARSLAARAQLHCGHGDGQSSSSSNAQTKERSLTEGSSLDLEWDHEAGVEPLMQPRSQTEENLAEMGSLNNMPSTSAGVGSQHSSDLEWDDSFLSADEHEQRQLIGMSRFRRFRNRLSLRNIIPMYQNMAEETMNRILMFLVIMLFFLIRFNYVVRRMVARVTNPIQNRFNRRRE